MKLKKVTIKSRENHATMSGGAHFHVFKNDETGELAYERTTAEAHAMQKRQGGSLFNPSKNGYTWLYTFGTYEYDTPDGELGEGQYAEDGDKVVFRPINGKPFEIFGVSKKKIVNDDIADTEVAKIRKEIESLNLTIL